MLFLFTNFPRKEVGGKRMNDCRKKKKANRCFSHSPSFITPRTDKLRLDWKRRNEIWARYVFRSARRTDAKFEISPNLYD